MTKENIQKKDKTRLVGAVAGGLGGMALGGGIGSLPGAAAGAAAGYFLPPIGLGILGGASTGVLLRFLINRGIAAYARSRYPIRLSSLLNIFRRIKFAVQPPRVVEVLKTIGSAAPFAGALLGAGVTGAIVLHKLSKQRKLSDQSKLYLPQ